MDVLVLMLTRLRRGQHVGSRRRRTWQWHNTTVWWRTQTLAHTWQMPPDCYQRKKVVDERFKFLIPCHWKSRYLNRQHKVLIEYELIVFFFVIEFRLTKLKWSLDCNAEISSEGSICSGHLIRSCFLGYSLTVEGSQLIEHSHMDQVRN